MTGNQRMALKIMGYVPSGYVLVTHDCNHGYPFPLASIYVDGKMVCRFKILPEDTQGK